jgi:TPR repeat protein
VIYLEGKIADQDLEVAARDFARASKLGNVSAAANLAGMILSGKGTRPDADVERAFDQLEQECSRGGRQKYYFLVGWAYETGRGRPRERGRALDYYRQGCERGKQAACEGVARLESWTATVAPVAR